uniref:Putative indole-3-acetic acid-amido synthetase GH3.6 n=1 Tax=Anthurium amnicola TaxID=1678845 RepID=A0A1D1YDG0_9ARAE
MDGAGADEEVLRRLEEYTRDAPRRQLETLRAILDRNAGCGYLRGYLLPPSGHPADHAPPDAESFRRLVPVSSYDDYADHIQQMADGTGDTSALSSDPLVCFFYSSGTSSTRPKMIPFFDSQPAKAASSLAHQASSALLRRLVPPRPTINRILWFLYAGNVSVTRAGFKVMAASAFPFHSRGPNPSPSPMFSLCVSPQQVIMGTDTQQQTYCHLLCGLRNWHLIDGIRAPYAAGLVRAFRLLESKWEQLCEDIEHGTVSSEVTDPVMRDAVGDLLGGPRPEVAGRIREICGRGRWEGILRELWAEVRYVSCVTTGTMEQYYHVLRYYAGSSVPLLCGDYFASECSVGINMGRMLPPQETSFVILPTSTYFEFLPFDIGSTYLEKELVDISGLEIGKMYEVVVTTYRGFYRYRLGDVVRVVGFHNTSPRVEFVTRAPKDYSDVFTERDLMSAVESFQVMLRDNNMGDIVEYAGFSDSVSSPEHVIIFLEMGNRWMSLGENRLGVLVLKSACQFLETSLGSVYKVKRTRGDLGPIEIAIVKPGSFNDLARVAVENGAPANQYKPPKILRNRNFVDFLKASVTLSIKGLNLDE